MNRMPESLEGIEWLITNKDEAETYLDVSIEDKESWKEAAELFVQKGIYHVVITWWSKGIMYAGSRYGNIAFYQQY